MFVLTVTPRTMEMSPHNVKILRVKSDAASQQSLQKAEKRKTKKGRMKERMNE